MQILVISDIHANLTALEAVLNAANAADEVWFLGDLVGYGPDPNQCVEIVRNLQNLRIIIGNHDAAVLNRIDPQNFNTEARISLEWTKSQVTDSSLEFLESIPEVQVIDQVTLAHGSPREPVWEYLMDTYTAYENFPFFDTEFCFVGHSHLPTLFHLNETSKYVILGEIEINDPFELEARSIINPGSVGQPRDQDPRAAYAIFNPLSNIWEFKRVEYAIDEVQERMKKANLPTRHIQRLSSGW